MRVVRRIDVSSNWVEALKAIPLKYRRVTASTSYVPQIDGLRFLAILQVVVFHAALRGQRAFDVSLPVNESLSRWLSHGVAGVELFFFISAYIVSYPFLAGHGPSYGAFLKRRLYRLEPPYLLALLLCWLALLVYKVGDEAPGFHQVEAPLWQSLVASAFYLHGLIFEVTPRLNPPLWSLELEIQFYLLAPFLIAAYRAISPDRTRRMAAGLVLVAALIPLYLLLSKIDAIFDFTLINHGYAFLLGIVLCDHAIGTRPMEQPPRRLFDLLLLLGIPLFILSGSLYNPSKASDLTFGSVILMRAFAIVLIYLGAMRGNMGRKLFGASWIALIGGACYSIYLTHVPVLEAASALVFRFGKPPSQIAGWVLGDVLLIPIVLLCGMIFYLLIERPCMERDWPSKVWQRMRALKRGDGGMPTWRT
jgi:peptidoglycan/LPS O-acetylase OafA/YrhL